MSSQQQPTGYENGGYHQQPQNVYQQQAGGYQPPQPYPQQQYQQPPPQQQHQQQQAYPAQPQQQYQPQQAYPVQQQQQQYQPYQPYPPHQQSYQQGYQQPNYPPQQPNSPQGIQPPQPHNQGLAQAQRILNDEFCGCMNDMQTCLITFCFPQCQFGVTYEESGQGSCCLGCCCYCFLCVSSRQHIQRLAQVREDDCLIAAATHYFCGYCAIVQEARAVKAIKASAMQAPVM